MRSRRHHYSTKGEFTREFYERVEKDENKERFIDLEDNWEVYKEIYYKVYDVKYNRGYLDKYYANDEKYKVDYRDLYIYEYNDEERDEDGNKIRIVNSEKLMPIYYKINDMIKELREEWEKEWNEGKRSYIWEKNKV